MPPLSPYATTSIEVSNHSIGKTLTNSTHSRDVNKKNRDRDSNNNRGSNNGNQNLTTNPKRWSTLKKILQRPASSSTSIGTSSNTTTTAAATGSIIMSSNAKIPVITAAIPTTAMPMSSLPSTLFSLPSSVASVPQQHYNHPLMFHDDQHISPRPHTTTTSYARQKRHLKELKLRNMLNDMSFHTSSNSIPPIIDEETTNIKNNNRNENISNYNKHKDVTTNRNNNRKKQQKTKQKNHTQTQTRQKRNIFQLGLHPPKSKSSFQKISKQKSTISNNIITSTSETNACNNNHDHLQQQLEQLKKQQQQQMQQNYNEIIDARLINVILNEKLSQKDALIEEQMKMIEELVEQIEVLSRLSGNDSHNDYDRRGRDLVPREVEFDIVVEEEGEEEMEESQNDTINI